MFNRILVCLDGSKLAESILPYAVEEATRFNSELILFRAFSEPSLMSLNLPGMPAVSIESARVEKHLIEDGKEVETYLNSLARKLLEENKLAVKYAKAQGPAGSEIVDYCRKNEVELIAIATHGRSGPSRVVLGSVADYVIRRSGVPILLVRPPQLTGQSENP